MPDFRRGAAAIQAANESAKSGGKDYKPFLPNIYWKNDGDLSYIWILNPVEDIPLVKFHSFVELPEGRFDQVIARNDAAIGERVDPLEERWKYPPKDTNLCVAVELEPIVEMVDGYARPRGFQVKTVEFERRIRDDEGELTDERETVEAPKIGLIAQSPNNFFNHLSAFDATDGPVHKTPFKVTRMGERTNTEYSILGYVDMPLDMTNLFEWIDQVSFAQDTDLLDQIEDLDDAEAAVVIGNVILDKRLEELCEVDHYNEVLGQVDKVYRYAKKEDKEKATKADRPARPSQRRGRRTEAEPVAEVTPEPEAKETPKDTKPRARRRSQAEKTTKTSPVEERLAKLRAKAGEVAAEEAEAAAVA
jgi:hypothetical protein